MAINILRPISRKYDIAEHEYPKELDLLAAMIDGMTEAAALAGAGAGTVGGGATAPTAGRGRTTAQAQRLQPGRCWG